MSKTKIQMIILAHVALAIFFIVAIWPALQVDNDRYYTIGNIDEIPAVAIEQSVDSTPVAPMVPIEVEASVEEKVVDVQPEVIEKELTPPPVEAIETGEVAVSAIAAQKPATQIDVTEDAIDEPSIAAAEIHIVTAEGLKFAPLVVKIAPGDMIVWRKMATHDTQSIEELIPEGAEGWHSKMGEGYQRTFTQEGIYIYKCTPHFGGGMGGVIIVGKPVNLEAIKAAPVTGAARRLVKKAIQAVEAAG